MKFANKDRFMWFQFGLSLMSSGRYARSSKILEHCVKLEASDHNNVAEHLMIAKVNLESLGDYDLAMEHASNALNLCHNNWQSSRCTLVYALAFSQKLQTVSSFDTRKVLMVEAIKHFEKAIHLDPHDELAHLYTALQYALCRDLEKSIEHCQRSLEINDEQPSAIMLMALLFTARRDFKSALTLVLNALIDYPNHYGLLVLRLKLEAKYEESDVQNGTMEKAESAIQLKAGSVVQLSSKDALAPVTPMFTAPLGIAAASHVSLTNSNLDIAENGSVLASTAANLSEYGGAASTVSGSLGIMSSGSNFCSIAYAFRIQANIWVELAEFFIELDRTTEVQACVEEACNIFPNSHEALYLKSRLFLIRCNKASNASLSKRYRSEAKSCLLAALSVLPTHLPSLQCLASIYHTEGNFILAEKMLRDMITVDPLHFKQWYELGCILAGQKRYDEAQECFETAGELESSTPIMPFTVIPKLLKNNFA
uniref:Uncharacterized protein n=1 Tax=Panagrolaimus superbus TaxID=310955 RepID=A0A914YFC1_9BILA